MSLPAPMAMYLRWRGWLPSWARLVPVELPGRGTRMSEAFMENFVTRRLLGDAPEMAHGPALSA